jgi:hypothetical protein
MLPWLEYLPVVALSTYCLPLQAAVARENTSTDLPIGRDPATCSYGAPGRLRAVLAYLLFPLCVVLIVVQSCPSEIFCVGRCERFFDLEESTLQLPMYATRFGESCSRHSNCSIAPLA